MCPYFICDYARKTPLAQRANGLREAQNKYFMRSGLLPMAMLRLLVSPGCCCVSHSLIIEDARDSKWCIRTRRQGKTKAAYKSFPARIVPSWKLTSANFAEEVEAKKGEEVLLVTLSTFSIRARAQLLCVYEESGARACWAHPRSCAKRFNFFTPGHSTCLCCWAKTSAGKH